LDIDKIKLWVAWMQHYYSKGATIRNKCQHLCSYLAHLKTVPGWGDKAAVRQKISLCRQALKRAAQNGKIKATKDKAKMANEEEQQSTGTVSSSSSSLSSRNYYSF
jgi:hypothetical protein